MNKRRTTVLHKAFLFLCVASFLCACSKSSPLDGQTEGGNSGNRPIVFRSTIGSNSPDEQWSEGDRISVQIEETVHLFTADAEGVLSPAEPLSWSSDKPHKIEAWYPFADSRPTIITIAEDQSAQPQPDFLFSKTTMLPQEPKPLHFDHQLAKIDLRFNTQKQIDRVLIGNEDFHLKAHWNEGWTDASMPNKITPKHLGENKYAALVIPQRVAAGKFIRCMVNGKPMYYALKEPLELKAGNVYTFTLNPDEGMDPQAVQPTLNADKAEILADGKECVTFQATPSTAEIIGVGHSFSGKTEATFSTTKAGSYQFKATNDGLETDILRVIAFDAPLLSASPTTIQVGETASLKVLFKGIDRTADAQFTQNGVAFSGSQFRADHAGQVTVEAKVDGYRSNQITIEVQEKPKEKPTLEASVTSIHANGTDIVRFQATPKTARITCRELPEFRGEKFQTDVAGNYTFVATDEGLESDPVTITVEEVAPVLLASTNQIAADGKQTVRFTVERNGKDVTNDPQTSLTKDGAVFEGRTFSSTIAQSYEFKAVYNNATSQGVRITVNPIQTSEWEVEQTLLLSAQFYEAAKFETVPLTVYYNGKVTTHDFVVFASDNGTDFEELADKTFAPWKYGTFYVYVKYKGATSNVIRIDGKASPNKAAQALEPNYPQFAASKSEMTADGTDFVSFTVYPSGTTIVKETPEGNWVQGRFTADFSGEYIFHAEYMGKRSGSISIKAVGAANPDGGDQPNPQDPLLLSASAYTIGNNGQQAELLVKQSQINVTRAAQFVTSGGQITDGKFTSVETGVFDIYAIYNGKKSNTIQVEVYKVKVPEIEIGLKLTADKTQIKGDGLDQASFEVKRLRDNASYTHLARYFINGKFVGEGSAYHTFSSTTAGVYKIHAEAGQIGTQWHTKSNTVEITVTQAKIRPTLQANRTKIRANGYEKVIFTASPSTATIRCEELPDFRGAEFRSTQQGVYHFVAINDGLESQKITIEVVLDEGAPMAGDVSISDKDIEGWDENNHDDTIIVK